jgi:hypothetical protein
MRIAFAIDRLINFKFYATLIQGAIDRGWEVYGLLNHRDVSHSTKWYEYPDIKKCPTFNDKITYVSFTNDVELEHLCKDLNCHYIFFPSLPKISKMSNQKWVHLVTAFADSFCTYTAEELDQFDLLFNDTTFWVHQCLRLHEVAGKKWSDNLKKRFFSKIKSTGIPQYDHFHILDKSQARSLLGIVGDKKVLTVFKFEAQASFWSNKLFHESSLLKRIINWLTLPLSYPNFLSKIGKKKLVYLIFKSLADRIKYFSEVFRAPNEESVLKAIRDFCDKNNMIFLLKYRKKNPLSNMHKKYADIILADESYYPYTSSQALVASDLSIALWSCAVAESVYAKVPAINLFIDDTKLFYEDQYMLLYEKGARERAEAEMEVFYNSNKDELFNTKMVVYPMDMYSFPKKFPNMKLSDFPFDDVAAEKYIRKNISENLDSPTKNILDELDRDFKLNSKSQKQVDP